MIDAIKAHCRKSENKNSLAADKRKGVKIK
jgi:hypothetical protein